MAHHTGWSLVKALPPESERAVREFFGNFSDALDPLREDIVGAIEDGDIDPSSLSEIEVEVERHTANYTSDLQEVYRTGTQNGTEVGRSVAARRHSLDIAFDNVPQNILREFDEWSEEIVDSEVMETITDDVTNYIRGAHEEGLSIDDIAEGVNDELFDGRLQDHVAERNARTAVVSSSNAGTHSAYQDGNGVVAEQWLDTGPPRTRDTHLAAGGQIVSIGNSFTVGGFSARFPADPTLPVREIANCRCTSVPVFRDQLTDSEFATLEGGGRIWR